jgi:phosphoglycolate phosphatase-like HAD superfamily hydrolase
MTYITDRIEYVFVHFDGVILENILAPITYSIISKLGGVYSREIENNVFAKSQKHAAEFIINHLKLSLSVSDIINLYYSERQLYEAKNKIHFNPGAESLLSFLRNEGYKVISYGGAPTDYFLKNAHDAELLLCDEKYIQTKDIRPGVKEIAFDKYHLKPSQALFIDEEYNIAEAAKANRIPFIGISTGFPYSFQKSEMENLGVKYIVDSIAEINESLLKQVQEDVLNDELWKNK